MDFFKSKSLSITTKFLAFLRSLTVFGLLLLLINPILSRSTYETIKTPLPIVVDNSSSILDLKANQTVTINHTLEASGVQLNDAHLRDVEKWNGVRDL